MRSLTGQGSGCKVALMLNGDGGGVPRERCFLPVCRALRMH